MRPGPWTHLDHHRLSMPGMVSRAGDRFGLFEIPHAPTNITIRVIATIGHGWEHVSASTRRRCPNWPEMEFICRQFWGEDEAVMQLHPPRSDWISNHPFCLHLWKPIEGEIPRPPPILVGHADAGEADPGKRTDRERMFGLWLAQGAAR